MDRLYNAIGLAMKAGKAQSGAFAAENAIRSGKAKLVLIEASASPATRDRYERMCAARKIPLYPVETVGRAIGRESRIVCAITDTAFQKMIEGAMPNTDEKRG